MFKCTTGEIIKDDFNLWNKAKEEGYITQANYVNRGKLFQGVLTTINDYQLYNKEVLVKSLEDYGFTTSTYINDKEKIYKQLGSTFKEQLNCLMGIEQDELLVDYGNLKKKLINKNDGSFSPKLAFLFLTAYLLNQTNAKVLIERLGNKRLYSGEFYKSVNLFLRVNGDTRNHSKKLSVNELIGAKVYADDFAKEQLSSKVWLTDDWQMLYSIIQISANKIPSDISEELLISEILYDKQLYLKYKDNTNNRLSNIRAAITKSLISQEIPITNTRQELINSVIKSNYKKIDKDEYINYNSKKSLKGRMKEAITFLLTEGESGKGRTIKFREYNPLTLLPRALRPIIPIRYVEVDMSSANPQIVDTILGTNIAMMIYNNLVKKRKITRSQAKKLYNETLNKHQLDTSEAVRIYLDAGYSRDKAKELASFTTGVEKGAFYLRMTKAEEKLTNLYKETLCIKTYRFHDAIVMKESDIRKNNIILPLELESVEDDIQLSQIERVVFHIGYYNAPKTKYEGMVTHNPHPTNKTIPNYRSLRGIKGDKSRVAS